MEIDDKWISGCEKYLDMSEIPSVARRAKKINDHKQYCVYQISLLITEEFTH